MTLPFSPSIQKVGTKYVFPKIKKSLTLVYLIASGSSQVTVYIPFRLLIEGLN